MKSLAGVTVFIICIIALLYYGLCMHIRRSPWKVIQEDAPLCGAGKTAESKSRICYPPFFVPAAEWTEYAWDTGKHLIKRESIVGEADKYLYNNGFINKLTDIVGWVDGIDQRIAPYRFFIVSLDPTIVIMTDYNYGGIEHKSNNDLRGKLNDRCIEYSKYLVNGYHYGSSIPKMANYKWFATEYSKSIQDVTKDGVNFIIKTKTATLVFGDNENNGWYVITRK